MPGRERQGYAVLPHECRGHRGAMLLEVERNDEAGISVGFQ